MFIQTLATARTTKVRTGWPYRWFWKFFSGLAKSPRVLPSSWILNECNLYCEILLSVRGLYDKNSASYYRFTSEVMYKWYKRLVYTHPDFLARFCKVNLSNAKNLAWFFFPGLINLRWSRAIMALKCDRRSLPVFGCTYEAINSM